jgi:hypothetical protein
MMLNSDFRISGNSRCHGIVPLCVISALNMVIDSCDMLRQFLLKAFRCQEFDSLLSTLKAIPPTTLCTAALLPYASHQCLEACVSAKLPYATVSRIPICTAQS